MRQSNMWKKTAACIMAAAMTISMCGCGNEGDSSTTDSSDSAGGSTESSSTESSPEEQEQGSEDPGTEESESSSSEEQAGGITYPLEEKVHLVLAMVDEAAVTANAKNLAETPFGQAWQEATGVELEIMQLADGNALNLLYAGGDLPDMIWMVSSYSGGAEKAIKDKIIEPLNDYMEFAPDFQAVLDSNELYAKSCRTSDGKIIGFPQIDGDDYLLTSAGLIIRQDWLDDLGLAVPQTADDLYEALKAFKEEKGASAPLSTTLWWLKDIAVQYGLFTSPFGLARGGFYQVDGKVHYGYAEQEYKDVLEYLHKLYEEGLLDPNFQSVDDNTVKANIMNGDTGVAIGNTGSYIGTMLETMAADEPDFDLSGFGPLVKTAGDIPMSTHYNWPIQNTYVIITPNCTNKEAAVKFLNYGYTEAGHMLFNYGIEGVSYTMENDVPTYTDLLMHNPDGLTKQLAMAQYIRAWNGGPFIREKGYQLQYSDLPQQQAALTSWSTSDASKYQMPPVTVSEENTSEYSKLNGDISTYVSEMFVRYVTGLESLDTFESGYLATLESMNVDRVIELQQEALDEFNSR